MGENVAVGSHAVALRTSSKMVERSANEEIKKTLFGLAFVTIGSISELVAPMPIAKTSNPRSVRFCVAACSAAASLAPFAESTRTTGCCPRYPRLGVATSSVTVWSASPIFDCVPPTWVSCHTPDVTFFESGS